MNMVDGPLGPGFVDGFDDGAPGPFLAHAGWMDGWTWTWWLSRVLSAIIIGVGSRRTHAVRIEFKNGICCLNLLVVRHLCDSYAAN